MKAPFLRVVDLFVPARPGTNRPRARLIVVTVYTLIAVAVAGFGIRLAIAPPPPVVFAIFAATLVLWVTVLSLMKTHGDLEQTSALVCVILLVAVLASAVALGGLDAPVLMLVPAVPLLASFLVGMRFGLALAGMTVLVLAVLAAPPIAERLPQSALSLAEARPARASILILAVLLTSIFAWFFESQRQRIDQRRKESEKRYRRLFEHARDAVVMTTPAGRLLDINPAGVELFGYRDRAEMLGLDVRELYVDGEERELLVRQLERDGFVAGFESRQRTRQGEVITIAGSTSVLRDEDGEISAFVGIIRDVTAQKAHQEQLERLASSDPLTGLANRHAFRRRLEQAIARSARFGHRIAVMVLDLDDLKSVNDSLGHAAGDSLIVAVATRLEANIRQVDTLARIGGDELAVIKTDFHEPEHAAQLARRLIAAVEPAIEIEGQPVHASLSIGIAVFPPGPSDPDALLEQADMALYRSKAEGGRTYHFYDSDIDHQVEERITLVQELEGALERGELDLDYQPQVELASGRVIAIEALLRWRHPQGGRLEPARFLALAEKSGRMVSIGRWVLETACRRARHWHDGSDPPLTLAVNLSAVEVRQSGFVEDLERILEHTGFPARALEIELDEATVMQAPHAIARTLRGLGSLGVSLALDDYGRGVASLVELRRFSFRKVKVDTALVGRSGRDADASATVHALVAGGRKLGLEVVAEGVETREQLELVRAAGCDHAQGYYLGPPVNAEEVRALLDGGGMIEKARVAGASNPVR